MIPDSLFICSFRIRFCLKMVLYREVWKIVRWMMEGIVEEKGIWYQI